MRAFSIEIRRDVGIQDWSIMIFAAVRSVFLAFGLALVASFVAFESGVDPEEIWHSYRLGKLAGVSIIIASIAFVIVRYAPSVFFPMTGLGLAALAIWNVAIGLDHNDTHRHAIHENAGLGLSDLVHTYKIVNAPTVIGGSLAPDLDVQQIMVFEDEPVGEGFTNLVVSLAGYLEADIASWSTDDAGQTAFREKDGGYRTVDLGKGLNAYISPALIEAPPASIDLCIILRTSALVLTERSCPPSATENGEGRS